MKRRAFLRTAAILPVAAWDSLSHAQTTVSSPEATTSSATEIHVVGAGQDRLNENHSLGYSTMLFKVLSRDTSDNLFIIEHRNLTKTGPPVHLHYHQDEWFYVMEGKVLFQVGDTRKTLGPGESVLGPRGVPHGFAPISETPAHMLIAFTPAGRMEAFFRETAVPNGPKMDPALFSRYDMRYVGPPLTVS